MTALSWTNALLAGALISGPVSDELLCCYFEMKRLSMAYLVTNQDEHSNWAVHRQPVAIGTCQPR